MEFGLLLVLINGLQANSKLIRKLSKIVLKLQLNLILFAVQQDGVVQEVENPEKSFLKKKMSQLQLGRLLWMQIYNRLKKILLTESDNLEYGNCHHKIFKQTIKLILNLTQHVHPLVVKRDILIPQFLFQLLIILDQIQNPTKKLLIH